MDAKLLAFASGICAFASVLIGLEVFSFPIFQPSDSGAAVWANQLRVGGTVSSILAGAASYGREFFWIPVVLVLVLLGDRATKQLALELGAIFLVGILVGEVTKTVLFRPRPFISLPSIMPRIVPDADSSFPSGHALIVSAGATFALVTFRRKWVALLLASEAGLVSFARVFVGVHYPTDVLAGITIGAAVALGGVAVERRYFSRQIERLGTVLVRLLKDGPLRL